MSDTRYVDFNIQGKAWSEFASWWHGIRPPTDNDRSDRPKDSTARATLQRCRTTTDVVYAPAYHDVLQRMEEHGHVNRKRLAAVVGLASHVRRHDPEQKLAKKMALPKNGDRSRVKDTRFRRLLQIKPDDTDRLYQSLTRVVRHLDHELDLNDLTRHVYYWNEETKRELAFEYYRHAPRQPQKE